MSEEQEQPNRKKDNGTPITRAWRIGGPMTPAQRKEAKHLFIDYLKTDPNVSAACDVAGIGRNTAYQWREHDKNFADEWEQAIERTKDVARSSIYQRGIIGWDEAIVSNGQLVYEMEPLLDKDENQIYEKGKPKMKRGKPKMVHKWSDSLAALYAKANLPEYKEKQQIDLNAQITTLADQAKDELLADLSAMIASEKTQPNDHEE